jgi:quercetin dioxygenase-like cupin family protein
MDPGIMVSEKDAPWTPHPVAKGIEIKVLLSRKAHGAEASVMLVRVAPGAKAEVPEHVHENSEDIIYTLKGSAKLWIQGQGEIDLIPGRVVRVPRNVKHRAYDISADFLVFDVFAPPTV